jgi:AraC-like DNA-binding protein
MPAETLRLALPLPIRAHTAGLFVSRGEGRHSTRTIDSHEIIFVRSGRLGMFEESRRFDVAAGQALHLRPGRQHGGTADYPADLSFYWLHFTLKPTRTVRSRSPALAVPQLVTVGRPDRMTELLRRFLDDQESGSLTETSGALLVAQLLAEMAEVRFPRPTGERTAAALAARAEQFVLTNFHRPIGAYEVAAGLGCNPDHLGRAFRRSRGLTLTEAINRRRLTHARRLLLDSVLNVDEIARAAGFSDAGYFRRVWRRREGMTPGAFRRLYARMHVNTD